MTCNLLTGLKKLGKLRTKTSNDDNKMASSTAEMTYRTTSVTSDGDEYAASPHDALGDPGTGANKMVYVVRCGCLRAVRTVHRRHIMIINEDILPCNAIIAVRLWLHF